MRIGAMRSIAEMAPSGKSCRMMLKAERIHSALSETQQRTSGRRAPFGFQGGGGKDPEVGLGWRQLGYDWNHWSCRSLSVLRAPAQVRSVRRVDEKAVLGARNRDPKTRRRST